MARRRLPWLCVFLIVACSHANHPAQAQSLVAVARLAREMREQVGPTTKIYTTADLPDIGRVTEPTLAWVSRYLALVEAVLERERVLLERRLERPAPVKTMRSTPPPTLAPPPRPTTVGIPLSLVYGAHVSLAWPYHRRPRDRRAVSDSPHGRGHESRPRDQRSRPLTTGPRASFREQVGRSGGRPEPRNRYEPSSRLFLYMPRGLPVPGTGRYGQATGATRGRW